MRSPAQSYLHGCLLLGALLALGGCGPKYPKCDKDEHCASKGEVCVEGTCQQCRDETQCAAGQQCKGGRCEAKPECAKDGDCSDNKVCRSGKCQTECTQDGDCGSGLKCKDSRCVDALACSDSSQCGPGLSCVRGRCAAETVSASRGMGCSYPRVRFAFNEYSLSEDAKRGLNEVAACLKEKGGELVIEGHCDERGTEEYNLQLGDQRANAVRKYLERLGVPAAKVRTVSKGELEPLSSAQTEEGWAQNRRAEFIER